MGDGFPAELRAGTCGKDYQFAMVVVEALELVEVEREAVELIEAWRKKKMREEVLKNLVFWELKDRKANEYFC